jgi:hypothetical protein
MPEKKHLPGVSDKEQRQYEHIKGQAMLFVVSVSASAYAPAPVSALEPAAELAPPSVAGPVAPGGTVPLPAPPPASPEPEELARRQLERARMSLASRTVETEYVRGGGRA